jgi:hypothetical protein
LGNEAVRVVGESPAMPQQNKPEPDEEVYKQWMNYGNFLYSAGQVKTAQEAWDIAEQYRPPTQVPKKPGL